MCVPLVRTPELLFASPIVIPLGYHCYSLFIIFRSYYFTEEELQKLFSDAGFEILMNTYVQRRTVNFKEGIDVPRIFVRGNTRNLLMVRTLLLLLLVIRIIIKYM